MSRIVYIATNNGHKVEEMQAALPELLRGKIEFRPAKMLEHQGASGGNPIDWDETGKTFQENAVIKCRTLRKYTSNAVLGDDSGLVIPSLGGAPGIYSSRYAGPGATAAANNAKLLASLLGASGSAREGYFFCSLCFTSEEGNEFLFEERCDGQITEKPIGDEGFGYDPLFRLPGGRTMAELMQTEKNLISHRGKALAKLWAHLILGRA